MGTIPLFCHRPAEKCCTAASLARSSSKRCSSALRVWTALDCSTIGALYECRGPDGIDGGALAAAVWASCCLMSA